MTLTPDEITVLKYLELKERGPFDAQNDPYRVAYLNLWIKGLVDYSIKAGCVKRTPAGEYWSRCEMKCPYSHELIATDAFCTRENLIDPAELLRLIEKAEELTTHDEIYEAIKLYSSDPSALKKLAGEE